MNRELGDKHVVVMASFTAAAFVAVSAYGFKRLLRKRDKEIVPSAIMGIMVEEREIKENELSEIHNDKQNVEPSTTVPLPISLPTNGIKDSDENKHDDEPSDKAKEDKDMEMEKLNASMKEFQEKLAKLSSQQTEINELKKKMKADEEKIDKLLWQENEINRLKTKITDDEKEIREMKEELIILRESKNKKKSNWWKANRVSVVNDVAEFDKAKKPQHK